MPAQLVRNKSRGDNREIHLVAGINPPGSTASARSPTSVADCCTLGAMRVVTVGVTAHVGDGR
jgi:hypothetical protein